MTHADTYRHWPYMVRKHLGLGIYFEVIGIRVKNGRIECLSRFNQIKGDGSSIGKFSYRWRKVCGKGIIIPSLNRVAKECHSWSLTISNPVSGKKNRVYISDLKKE